MKYFLMLAMAASAGAYELTLPQIGYFRDSANSVRPIYGLGGNFLCGDASDADLLSFGFTGTGGFLKSSNTLKVLDAAGQALASFDAPDGPAIVGMSVDHASAIVYYPQSTLWNYWHDGQLDTLTFDPGGNVLALATAGAGKFLAVICRDDGRWLLHIDIASASIDAQEPFRGTGGPVLLRGDYLQVYVDGTNLMIARKGGEAVAVDFSAIADSFTPESISDLGADWVHVRESGGGRNLALRITPGREQVFVFPEVAQ
jgi:hypothetical protein